VTARHWPLVFAALYCNPLAAWQPVRREGWPRQHHRWCSPVLLVKKQQVSQAQHRREADIMDFDHRDSSHQRPNWSSRLNVAKKKLATLAKATARKIAQQVNVPLGLLGGEIISKPRDGSQFSWDGLITIHDSTFMKDESFLDAYNHAQKLIGKDYRWYWRNYIGMNLAEYSFTLSPNFVECGVGDGWMTVSILRFLGKKYSAIPSFTLFDTFSGIDTSLVDPREEEEWGVTAAEKNEKYEDVYKSAEETVRKRIEATAGADNKVTIVPGALPNTLTDEVMEQVKQKGPISFLHIDMNNAVPEVAALKRFYPLMAPGGVILFDDYAYFTCTYQKNAIDAACVEMGIPVPISLPSGQGLLLKRH
jgi:hypothetical protein